MTAGSPSAAPTEGLADEPHALVEPIEAHGAEPPGTPIDASGRIPSLDGLRAISIAAVVVGHAAGTVGFPAAATALIANGKIDIAYLGVRVFFVISGFLITGILMKEHHRVGGISLKHFYLRRTVRIVPACYAYILALVVLTAAGIAHVTAGDVGHALTYTTNYYPERSWDVGHLWSLAVEEQFYLLWPFALVILGLRRGARAALAVVLLVPLIRTVEYIAIPGSEAYIGNSFESTADALAMGCLLALFMDQLHERAWFTRLIDSRWMIPAILVTGVGLNIRVDSGVLIGSSLENLAVALIIAHCVLRPNGLAGRMLNTRPLVIVGVLSYSIYLWQQLFLNRASTEPMTSFPLNIGLVAIAALGSYLLVERPFLRARSRLETRLLGGAPATARPQGEIATRGLDG